jgi:Rrf2 family protein
MKVSVRCDYAVTVLIYLAIREPSDPPTLCEISTVTKISPSYLEIILSGLRRAGLLKSGRGPKSGYYFGIKGTNVSIAEVAQAVDPEYLCFGEVEAGISHQVTTELNQSLHSSFLAQLEAITIQSLVKANQKYIKACNLKQLQ